MPSHSPSASCSHTSSISRNFPDSTIPRPAMSHFVGHKPKSSPLGAARRTSVAAVFAALLLLFYTLLPRSSFPTATSQAARESGLPAEPVAQQVEREVRELLAKTVDDAVVDTRQSPSSSRGCLRTIIYDKPVKTASTAITYALREYLKSTGRLDLPCNMLGDSCREQTERVCKGTHRRQAEEPSFLGHLKQSDGSTIECLKRLGYYAVTSIRDPYQRRKSAYLYNKTVKGMHYSIPHTASFKEFMERLPRCILYNDYDGLGRDCDVGMSLEERTRRIVDRYDEVIELGEEARGPLFRKIVGFIDRENESRKEDIQEDFNKESLKEEQMLYDALRAKMLRAEVKDRVPC